MTYLTIIPAAFCLALVITAVIIELIGSELAKADDHERRYNER